MTPTSPQLEVHIQHIPAYLPPEARGPRTGEITPCTRQEETGIPGAMRSWRCLAWHWGPLVSRSSLHSNCLRGVLPSGWSHEHAPGPYTYRVLSLHLPTQEAPAQSAASPEGLPRLL